MKNRNAAYLTRLLKLAVYQHDETIGLCVGAFNLNRHIDMLAVYSIRRSAVRLTFAKSIGLMHTRKLDIASFGITNAKTIY